MTTLLLLLLLSASAAKPKQKSQPQLASEEHLKVRYAFFTSPGMEFTTVPQSTKPLTASKTRKINGLSTLISGIYSMLRLRLSLLLMFDQEI